MWESEVVAEKLRQMSAKPQRVGRLAVHEGGKMSDGRVVVVGILGRLWARLRRGHNEGLRVVK